MLRLAPHEIRLGIWKARKVVLKSTSQALGYRSPIRGKRSTLRSTVKSLVHGDFGTLCRVVVKINGQACRTAARGKARSRDTRPPDAMDSGTARAPQFFSIRGSVTSMLVAPPAPMARKGNRVRASTGIRTSAIDSRSMFERNDTAPSPGPSSSREDDPGKGVPPEPRGYGHRGAGPILSRNPARSPPASEPRIVPAGMRRRSGMQEDLREADPARSKPQSDDDQQDIEETRDEGAAVGTREYREERAGAETEAERSQKEERVQKEGRPAHRAGARRRGSRSGVRPAASAEPERKGKNERGFPPSRPPQTAGRQVRGNQRCG